MNYDEAAAVRLRGICGDLGLGSAIPETNEQLMGVQFAVFGMIRRALAKGVPADFHTHRDAWRQALILARDSAEVSAPDIDDRAYWAHEIAAFDRAYSELAAAPQAEPGVGGTCDGRGCPVCNPAPEPSPQARELADAQRWRETLMRVGATSWFNGGHMFMVNIEPPPNVMQGSVAQHFTAAIDAARGAAWIDESPLPQSTGKRIAQWKTERAGR